LFTTAVTVKAVIQSQHSQSDTVSILWVAQLYAILDLTLEIIELLNRHLKVP